MHTFPFQKIISWYQKHGRHDLPWREYDHDEQQLLYRVWASEIMLQQTQVDRVIGYYERFLERFPTIQNLAKVEFEEFFPYYEGLGYYNRGKNMLKLAKEVVKIGDFPRTIEGLESLPGVGPYTARAILSFSLDEPILSFDTNLSKIFSRYYFGDKSQKLTKEQEQEIQKQFEKTGISGRDMNNALMDFGALVSLRNPEKMDWENYLLKDCLFGKSQGANEKIVVRKRSTGPKREVAEIVVILHENHKKYYSSEEKQFEPFTLTPTQKDHRHFIQDWFESVYDLKVSVRPSFKKTDTQIFYHTQIQTGNPDFSEHQKTEVQEYLKNCN